MSKNCDIIIKYEVDGEEQTLKLFSDTFPDDVNISVTTKDLLNGLSRLSPEQLQNISDSLSPINSSKTSVTYSNGEPLIGNFNLNTIREKFSLLEDKQLYHDFEGLVSKLEDLNISPSDIHILLLEGDNITLNVNGTTGIRGTLLNNNFIIINGGRDITEDTLKDLYHEMLHLYFHNLPRSDERIKKLNDIANSVVNTAKNSSNDILKEFVSKVTKNGKVDLDEFIAYIISDVKYRSLLGFDLNSGKGKEFLDTLYEIDDRGTELGREVDLSNISEERVWDGKAPVYEAFYSPDEEGNITLYSGRRIKSDRITSEMKKAIFFDPDNNEFMLSLDKFTRTWENAVNLTYDETESDPPPFVGQFDSEYNLPEDLIPQDISQNRELKDNEIWKNFSETYTEDIDNATKKQRRDLNYSESVKITSPIQIQALKEGDLVLIPSLKKEDGKTKYGRFNDKYFSYKKWLPVRSVWKNSKGEVLITCLNMYGDKGLGNITLSYTDWINSLTERNLQPQIKKFYGRLKLKAGDSSEATLQAVKAVRDKYESDLESEDFDNSPLVKSHGITHNGSVFTYYAGGKSGFKLRLDEKNDNSLLTQELRRGDIVKAKLFKPNSAHNGYESFEVWAPVFRAYGTVVEIAMKRSDGKGYFTQIVPSSNIQQIVFSKSNHSNLVELHQDYIENEEKYKENTKNKNLYQQVWFNLPGLKEDKMPNTQLRGDFTDAIDTQSVIDYRREKLKQLKVGDSVAVFWGKYRPDGSAIISKHLVIGISGDQIFFLNKNQAKEGEEPTTKVSSVDIKTVKPIYASHIAVPSLSALYYNNINDKDLVRDLESKKQEIANFFDSLEDLRTFDFDSGSPTSLNDFYDIINVDDSNVTEEAAKLIRGDIIKYREGNREYVGVVSHTDILNGVVEVSGYFGDAFSNDTKTFRKNIDLDQIIYVGFNLEPNYDLGIIGHPEMLAYKNKRVSRLYDMNHSTYGLPESEARKKADALNKNYKWCEVAEVKYIVPRKSTQEFEQKFEGSKERGVKDGRMTIIDQKIREGLAKGDYIDLTEQYIQENKISTPDGKLYGLKKTVTTGDGRTYEFNVANSTGLNYVKHPWELPKDRLKDLIQINDIIQLNYSSKTKTNGYTKYLRVKSKTDRGITLEAEFVSLDGKPYTSKWYVKYEDLESGKYKIYSWWYPNSKTRDSEFKSIKSNPDFKPQPPKYYIQSIDRFNKKALLNRIIDNINSTFKTDTGEDLIKVITTDDVKEWTKGSPEVKYIANKLMYSGAFIWNNQIYINTDLAKLSSPIHELMHLVMGIMKQTSPELYNSLLDRFSTFGSVVDKYREALMYRSMDQAKEEAFVDTLGHYLQGVFSEDNFKIDELLTSTNFFNQYINTLSDGFKLDIDSSLSKDIAKSLAQTLSNMNIQDLIMEFNSVLLKARNNSLFKSKNLLRALNHRQLNNIISSLLTSEIPGTKLIENC